MNRKREASKLFANPQIRNLSMAKISTVKILTANETIHAFIIIALSFHFVISTLTIIITFISAFPVSDSPSVQGSKFIFRI